MSNSNSPFAVFVIAHFGLSSKLAVTTRDGKDAGRIGLPGGKVDAGETPVQAAIREAAEEGFRVKLDADAQPVHMAMVEGKLVYWYYTPWSVRPLVEYKEKARGIKATYATVEEVANSGFGNEFISDFCKNLNL